MSDRTTFLIFTAAVVAFYVAMYLWRTKHPPTCPPFHVYQHHLVCHEN